MAISDVVDEETFKLVRENGWQNLSSDRQLMFFKKNIAKGIVRGITVSNTNGYKVESYYASVDGSRVKCSDAHTRNKDAVKDYIKDSLVMYAIELD
jgi:hypothetical protein